MKKIHVLIKNIYEKEKRIFRAPFGIRSNILKDRNLALIHNTNNYCYILILEMYWTAELFNSTAGSSEVCLLNEV